jgi:hypothetical protein
MIMRPGGKLPRGWHSSPPDTQSHSSGVRSAAAIVLRRRIQIDGGVCRARHSGRASTNAKGHDQHQKERLHHTCPLVVRIGAGDLGRPQRRLTSPYRGRDLSDWPLGAASPDYKIGFNLAGAHPPVRLAARNGIGAIDRHSCSPATLPRVPGPVRYQVSSARWKRFRTASR